MVDSQLSFSVDNLIANILVVCNLIVHNLESFTCGFIFLNLHQDTRSSNGLRIHNNLSSNVQCHCPSCLLTTPLGSNHMQKEKKNTALGLGGNCIGIFWGAGLCQNWSPNSSPSFHLPALFSCDLAWSLLSHQHLPPRTVWKCSQVFRKKLICTIPSGRCKTSQKQCWALC